MTVGKITQEIKVMKRVFFAILFHSVSASAQMVSGVPVTGTAAPRPESPLATTQSPADATKSTKASPIPKRKPVVATTRVPEAPQLPPPSQVSRDFYSAVALGNLQMADLLLQQGADINCQNCGNTPGWTPLLHAASNPYVADGQQTVLSWLITRGANINTQGFPHKKSALMYLSGQDSFDALAYVIRAGADTTLKDKDGATVLHYLSAHPIPDNPYFSPTNNPHEKWLKNIKLLLSGGLSINVTNDDGVTPLMLAVSRICDPDIVRLYLSLGADPSIKTLSGDTAARMAYKRAIASNDARCNEAFSILSNPPPRNVSAPLGGQVADRGVSTYAGSHEDKDASVVAGDWLGYIKVISPVQQTVPISGSISATGLVTLAAPSGVTTSGRVETVGGDSVSMLLRNKAPAGKTFADGSTEGKEFRVDATRSAGIIRGNYVSPMESGEFLLCTRSAFQTNGLCRAEATASTGNPLKDLGNALDSLNKVLSGLGKR